MISRLIVVLTITCIFLTYWPCNAQQEPKLSAKEKEAVDKLKQAIEPKLTAAYMKSDAYLIKWLKAKKFDHAQALAALEKALEWRKEVDADNLPDAEYLRAYSKNYVLDFTARDKYGNPLLLFPYGDWDVRKKALEGKLDDLQQRLNQCEETLAQLGFNLTGNPTGFAIVDYAGFSLRQHGCIQCIPLYVRWVRSHELYYPYNLYRILFINTPSIMEPILNLMRPLMTESTREAFNTMGFDREEWSKFIAETVSLDTLPHRFGGNVKRKP